MAECKWPPECHLGHPAASGTRRGASRSGPYRGGLPLGSFFLLFFGANLARRTPGGVRPAGNRGGGGFRRVVCNPTVTPVPPREVFWPGAPVRETRGPRRARRNR